MISPTLATEAVPTKAHPVSRLVPLPASFYDR